MINILYIAYQFPPLNVGGSARPARFVKHLSKHGIQSTVVTLDAESYTHVYPNAKADSNLLEGIEKDIEILKVPSENLLKRKKNPIVNFLSTFFNIYKGSEKQFWKVNYHKIVDNYLSKNQVSAIIVTAPPFGVLPLAVETSKKHKIPLIVDMRDHWTLWGISPFGTYFNFLASKKAEYKVLKAADIVIATSKVTLNDLCTFHKLPKEKFKYIPNSYEETIAYKTITYEPQGPISIGYVGSFYYSPESRLQIMSPWYQRKGHRMLQYAHRQEDWLYRSPHFFFKHLSHLFKKYPELKSRITVKFAGHKAEWFNAMVAEFQLQDNVVHVGWVSHSDSLKFQKSCDFLLLTSAKVLGGKDYSIAGKTFEYFRMQKPILALLTEGAQKDLITQSGIGLQVNLEDDQTAVHQLHRIFTTSQDLIPNKKFIDSFHIDPLAESLANTIKSVIKT